MAGLPLPIKASPSQMVLSISDIKDAGSAVLAEGARGTSPTIPPNQYDILHINHNMQQEKELEKFTTKYHVEGSN